MGNGILLTGKEGQLGWELQRALATLAPLYSFDSHTLNLANEEALRKVVRRLKPSVIVNAAAYTDVERAEQDEKLLTQVNAIAPAILAEEAKRQRALLVHYSSDYVFDGKSDRPYEEEMATKPLNCYGRSKLEGERAIQAVGGRYLILRTGWIYGNRGRNFLNTMLQLDAAKQGEVTIVNDQVGTPTWSRLVANATGQLLAQLSFQQAREVAGIYHLSSSGQTSWYGFAAELFYLWRLLLEKRDAFLYSQPALLPISSEDYPTKARRPAYSVLDNEKLQRTFGITLPDWLEGLKLCLDERSSPVHGITSL